VSLAQPGWLSYSFQKNTIKTRLCRGPAHASKVAPMPLRAVLQDIRMAQRWPRFTDRARLCLDSRRWTGWTHQPRTPSRQLVMWPSAPAADGQVLAVIACHTFGSSSRPPLVGHTLAAADSDVSARGVGLPRWVISRRGMRRLAPWRGASVDHRSQRPGRRVQPGVG
jgi:hypothetical protein